MRPHKERQAEAQATPTEELQRKYDAGGFGDIRPFVAAELAARKSAAESAHLGRAEAREDESLSISKQALAIANEANAIARSQAAAAWRAARYAMYAAIIATTAALVASKDEIFKLFS